MVKAALIIDGYNLILRLGPGAELAAGELARRRQVLEEHLILYGKREKVRPVVIYDGLRMAGGHLGARRDSHLEVLFADPPAIADDLIFQRAARHLGEACEVQVVTSDGGLATSVEKKGARVISAEEFGAVLVAMATASESAPPADAAMSDIHAHFMAVHRQEESRASAAVGGEPGREESRGTSPAAGAVAGRPVTGRQSPTPGATGTQGPPETVPPGAAARERKKKKGQRRQQRRLQSQAAGSRRRGR